VRPQRLDQLELAAPDICAKPCSFWTYAPLTPTPAGRYAPGRAAVRGRPARCDWEEALGESGLFPLPPTFYFPTDRMERINYRFDMWN
jgi:hypothetical protein